VATVVVKLGSSLVADERGAVRGPVLAQVCDEVATLHEAGDAVVIVTSGAIARGMGILGFPPTPTRPGQAVSGL
jgi:glutamate 5-kinase